MATSSERQGETAAMKQPWERTLAEASDMISKGTLSPVELTRSVLDRIATVESRVLAWARTLPQQALAEAVVRRMLSRDAFSRWLGIEVLEIAPRRSACRLTVRDDMVNGFGVAHGGIAYALADSALAFACNTGGRVTMAIQNSIGYPASANVGDVLVATAEEDGASNRLGFYSVTVRNQGDQVVATFRGTVYCTRHEHFPGPHG